MKSTRIWRLGTAALAASALLMTTAGGVASAQSVGDVIGDTPLEELTPDELDEILDQLDLENLDELLELLDQEDDGDPSDGDDETDPADAPDTDAGDVDVPGADLGGFIGEASATGLSIGVGLPGELAEPLAPLFDALGIAGTGDNAIAINLAETNANLQRAAEGEEVDGLANALILNLLLGSGAADQPGSCQGADTVALPDEQTPVLRVTVADIDCEQDDERAFASAHVAGASINLGNLIDLAGAEALREGLDELFEPVNDQLLAEINAACDEVLVPVGEGLEALPILNLDGAQLCEAVELNLQNVLNVDVPLLDVDLLEASSEVTHVDDVVTATATSGLANLQFAGLVCVEANEPGQELVFTSTASTDGDTGTSEAQASNATARLCGNSPLAQILDAETLLNSIEIAGTGAAELVDGTGEITSAIEEGLATLLVDTENSLSTVTDTQQDGAGAAAEARLDVLNLQLFRGVEPLAESPLGDITVSVTAMDTAAGVNAAPDGQTVPAQADDPDPAEPEQDLPRTGASLAGLVGLAALGAATALRRRDED